MIRTVLCLIFLSGCCLAANDTAADSKEATTIIPALSNKSEEEIETKSTRQDKAIDEDVDDLVIIVAGAPRLDDNDDVVVINGDKEGRAIVIDGIPVDNAAPGQAGFKLFKADDIKDKKGNKDEKEGRIKVLDDIPTDNSGSDSAGFRLPLAGNPSEPRIIEVLVAEEEDDFAPKSLKASESVDDVIIIEVGDSVEESDVDCFADREPGTCNNTEKAYFYDHETSKCQFFLYSGCGGNSNRFASEAECESQCKDAKRGEKDQNKKVCGSLAPACEEGCSLVKGDSECLECSCTKVDPKVCTEPHGKQGVCRALLLFWTYNPETKECETFTYGGCEAGASKNRFKTQELCQATCVPKEEV